MFVDLHSSKYLLLCSKEGSDSYMFGTNSGKFDFSSHDQSLLEQSDSRTRTNCYINMTIKHRPDETALGSKRVFAFIVNYYLMIQMHKLSIMNLHTTKKKNIFC